MKKPVAWPVGLEIGLVSLGLSVSLVMYASGAGGPISILTGILLYLLGNILKMRLVVQRIAASQRPVYALEDLCDNYRVAQNCLGVDHVFLRWLLSGVLELTEKAREVASMRFSVASDRIDMMALYDQAFGRGGPLRAFFPEDSIDYIRLPAGKVFWKTIWELQCVGKVTSVKRVFIAQDATLQSDDFQKLLRFHDALGWEAFVISPDALRNAVRGRMNATGGIASADNFSIYGDACACEASHVVDERMQVCFVAEPATVRAYIVLFDTTCRLARAYPRGTDHGTCEDFEVAYSDFLS